MFPARVGITLAPDGFLYVGDYQDNRIWKVSLDGDVSTLTGRWMNDRPIGEMIDVSIAEASFNAPWGIAANKDNNLYLADQFNNVIRKIAPDAMVSSFGKSRYYTRGNKDGPLLEASFNNPAAVVADLEGNLYIHDAGNLRLRKIYKEGLVTTVFGPEAPELSTEPSLF